MQAIKRRVAKTPAQVMHARNDVIDRCVVILYALLVCCVSAVVGIEKHMRESGACFDWFQGEDAAICGVSRQVSGRLFETLLQASQYVDHEAPGPLRDDM